MGVPLTPIIVKQTLALDDLRGRRLAVDGNGELYQFLALIRTARRHAAAGSTAASRRTSSACSIARRG